MDKVQDNFPFSIKTLTHPFQQPKKPDYFSNISLIRLEGECLSEVDLPCKGNLQNL